MTSAADEPRTLWRGRHLAAQARGDWEYVSRLTRRPAVAVVAVTDDGELLIVEQFRPPVGRPVMELPAGLAGDQQGEEDEPLLAAAKRELLEETGYVADHWTELGTGYTSPGLTDESIVFFLAESLQQRAPGGGDHGEAITVHKVPWEGLDTWLRDHRTALDLKLLAGLYAAQHFRTSPAADSPRE